MDTSMIGAYFPGWSSQKVVNSQGILPNTVNGRNPAPVEVGSLSHYLQGFIHPMWLFGISSINST